MLDNLTSSEYDWVIERLPQKEPMRFIDRVESVDIGARTIVCEFTAGMRPCVGYSEKDGVMPPVSLTETMAQTVAALMIAEDGINGRNFKIGFILSIRKMKIMSKEPIVKGMKLSSRVKISYEDSSGVCMAEACVCSAETGNRLTEARITVMKPDDGYVSRLFEK